MLAVYRLKQLGEKGLGNNDMLFLVRRRTEIRYSPFQRSLHDQSYVWNESNQLLTFHLLAGKL